jgi:hypothetical protein
VEWFQNLSPRRRTFLTGAAVIALAALFLMLRKHGKTADQALNEVYIRHPQLVRQKVAKFAGRVTIDGQLPGDLPHGSMLFVSLHRKQGREPSAEPLHAVCDSTGHFGFSTYLKEDGVPVGSYIVTFVKLPRVGRRVFGLPDELKNLYSDPERNSGQPEFVVDLQTPGKTDYQFDLAVAGQEPIETPGPRAVTRIASW